MSSSNRVRVAFIEESAYGITPTAVKASVVIQDLTYTADAFGENGNLISIAYTAGATAGAEVVTVVGNAISVQIEDGVSTATQVKAAVDGFSSAAALVDVTISGTAGDAQVIVSATFLINGFGNFSTARFTSESLSGTPETAESEQIRIDRMSSGQVVVGQTVGGDLNIEIAKEAAIDEFLESALYSTWQVTAPFTVDLTIVASTFTISRAAGSFLTDGLAVGRLVKLSGFSNSANNTQVMVATVGALSFTYIGPSTIVDEVGSGTAYDIADYLQIGIIKKSFSMEKKFTDLTTKGINYKGMIVDTFSMNIAHGELATGAMGFVGNHHSVADADAELLTYLRPVNDAATSQTLNGSVDMPFLGTDISGSFVSGGLGIQSVNISLANNNTAQNVIGQVPPRDYSEGTCQVNVEIVVYNDNVSWASLEKRLTQAPIQIGLMVKNADGYYAVYLPAVQLTFEDPSSAGQNQDILLNMSGLAKVGALGQSAITISRS